MKPMDAVWLIGLLLVFVLLLVDSLVNERQERSLEQAIADLVNEFQRMMGISPACHIHIPSSLPSRR